jgi:acylphosphatase
MNRRLEVIVHGRVQLVMYRDFVQRKASALGLTGEVKNLSDGTVRVIAEGEQAKLEKLLAKLHEGSILSRVDGVDASWGTAEGNYTKFKIAYA